MAIEAGFCEIQCTVLVDALCETIRMIDGTAVPNLKDKLLAAARDMVIQEMFAQGIGLEHEDLLCERATQAIIFAFEEARHPVSSKT